MVSLLGSGDELLHVIEQAFGADIHVRGNEITVTGEPAENTLVTALFEELIALLGSGAELSADLIERSLGMLRHKSGIRPGRGADGGHPVRARAHDPAQDAQPEALRGRHRQQHDRVRDRPGGHRQDLPGHGEGGEGTAGQGGQPDHPDPARRRGGGAPRLPARHPVREDRSLPAAAVRRAARHDRPRLDPPAHRRREHRDRPPGVHAGPRNAPGHTGADPGRVQAHRLAGRR